MLLRLLPARSLGHRQAAAEQVRPPPGPPRKRAARPDRGLWDDGAGLPVRSLAACLRACGGEGVGGPAPGLPAASELGADGAGLLLGPGALVLGRVLRL